MFAKYSLGALSANTQCTGGFEDDHLNSPAPVQFFESFGEKATPALAIAVEQCHGRLCLY